MDNVRAHLAGLHTPFTVDRGRAGSAGHHDDRHVREGRVRVRQVRPRVVGIAKGVGMIEPDMATLIALFLTDAAIDSVAIST